MNIRYFVPANSTAAAKRIAAALIQESIEFRCEPHPLGQWLFDVHLDQRLKLERIAEGPGVAAILPGGAA